MASRRRDYYDPITGRWISERTLLDRVARYDIERERLRDEAQAKIDRALSAGRRVPRTAQRLLAEASQYDAALDSFDLQTELREHRPRAQELPRVEIRPTGATLPPALRGYYSKARRLVDAWGFDPDESSGEWELGDDYSPYEGR